MKLLRMTRLPYLLVIIVALLFLPACGSGGEEAALVQPTHTTVASTETPEPEPTATELPPTEAPATAVPTATATLEPQPEPTATAVLIERFDVTNMLPLTSTSPVIEHGADGDWDRNLDITAVLYHDGQFHAFLNRFPGWPPTTFGLSYHTSPDGINWTQMADGPVFSEQDLPNQNHVPIGGSMHVEEDGTWVHYFFTWNKQSRGSVNYIGRATAPDPLGPWTADEEYVLEPGESGAWDSLGVSRPFVFKNEDGYVMYYVGKGGRTRIGMATSPDGISWTKYDDPTTTDKLYADSDPVFLPSDEPGMWDATSVADPLVLQTPDGWVMLYASPVSNGVRVGYALSDDGIHWRRSETPLPTFEAVPNKTALWSTELVYHEGTYYLFGEVKTGQFSGIYAATQEGSLLP